MQEAGAQGPLSAEEFAGLMDRLGPFGAGREVVVAVSGGADSLALAVLLRGWGQPLAVVVDHGLRPGSADEAAVTMRRLDGLGIAARQVTLRGLGPGPDLAPRARRLRYAALFEACREDGRPDLVVGHHAQDQAETVLLRAARGSGAAGLAAMAAVSWRADARVLRPLLAVEPGRLRATLRAAGVGWVEDPTNRDPATARGGLRAQAFDAAGLIREAAEAGRRRAVSEAGLAAEVGERVAVFPTGQARVRGEISKAAWSALLWTVSGRVHPPGRTGVARVAEGGGTLHGVRVQDGLVVREACGLAEAVPAVAGALWDGRFAARVDGPGGALGALGVAAGGRRRRPGLPSMVWRTSPAVRIGTNLFISPHLAYHGDESWLSVQVDFRPARPMAGAPFVPM